MAVLAGWESGQLIRTGGTRTQRTKTPSTRAQLPGTGERAPVGPRRHPVRRPPGLATASPARPPVTSCVPGYGRRRLVGLLLLAAIAAVLTAGLVVLRGVAADDGVPQRTAVVEVGNGETLWDLAERVAPRNSPQAVVERIRELNGMQGSTVHPGRPLLVPDGR